MTPKPRKPTRKAREMPVPQARACDGVGCPLVHPHYTFARQALKQDQGETMPVNGMREGTAPLPCPKCGKEPDTVGVTWNGWTQTSCECRPGLFGSGPSPEASIREWNTKVEGLRALIPKEDSRG